MSEHIKEIKRLYRYFHTVGTHGPTTQVRIAKNLILNLSQIQTSTSGWGEKLKYSYVLTKILGQGNGVREKLTRSKVVSTVENVILRHIGRNFSVFGGVV